MCLRQDESDWVEFLGDVWTISVTVMSLRKKLRQSKKKKNDANRESNTQFALSLLLSILSHWPFSDVPVLIYVDVISVDWPLVNLIGFIIIFLSLSFYQQFILFFCVCVSLFAVSLSVVTISTALASQEFWLKF